MFVVDVVSCCKAEGIRSSAKTNEWIESIEEGGVRLAISHKRHGQASRCLYHLQEI